MNSDSANDIVPSSLNRGAESFKLPRFHRPTCRLFRLFSSVFKKIFLDFEKQTFFFAFRSIINFWPLNVANHSTFLSTRPWEARMIEYFLNAWALIQLLATHKKFAGAVIDWLECWWFCQHALKFSVKPMPITHKGKKELMRAQFWKCKNPPHDHQNSSCQFAKSCPERWVKI